jgi:hypothetical protein
MDLQCGFWEKLTWLERTVHEDSELARYGLILIRWMRPLPHIIIQLPTASCKKKKFFFFPRWYIRMKQGFFAFDIFISMKVLDPVVDVIVLAGSPAFFLASSFAWALDCALRLGRMLKPLGVTY